MTKTKRQLKRLVKQQRREYRKIARESRRLRWFEWFTVAYFLVMVGLSVPITLWAVVQLWNHFVG